MREALHHRGHGGHRGKNLGVLSSVPSVSSMVES